MIKGEKSWIDRANNNSIQFWNQTNYFNLVIFITNLDPKKRPGAAVADNNEIRNVIKVNISVNKKIKFKLLFNSNESLSKKIKLEQRKKIN